MSRRLISSGSEFEKLYGYSRAVVDEPFCFIAGTTGYDYSTMTLPEEVGAQAKNCLRNIEAALAEAGFSRADLVRVTYYVTDPSFQQAVLTVVGPALAEVRPAATMLVVAALLKPEIKVEIEATAKRRGASVS